jgi:SagB-type dehydrogenase family enzyme
MRARNLLLLLLVAAGVGAIIGIGCTGATPPPAPAAGAEIALPAPKTTGNVSVEQALARRRSVRQFSAKDLTLAQIGQLAWAAQGITDARTGHRTAPSAVAMYPLQVYLFTSGGVFRYLPQGHKLLQLSKEDKRTALSLAAMGQAPVRNAPLDLVFTGSFDRMRSSFGAKADGWVYIEAGHAGENVHLQAVAMGLGSVTVGGVNPTEVAKVLGDPAGETVLYAIPIGYPG